MKSKKLKKVLPVIILAIIAMSMCACSSKGSSGDAQESSISIEKLQDDMIKSDSTFTDVKTITSEDEDAELNFVTLSDVDYDMIDKYRYSYTDNGKPYEIAVIKVKDENDVVYVVDSLKKHIEDRKGTILEYSPEDEYLVTNAVVTFEDEYIMLAICEKSGVVQNTFQSYFN